MQFSQIFQNYPTFMSDSVSAQMMANAVRALSIDAVQKAKSGHPGMPMGSAAMAYALVCGLGLGWLADRTGHLWPGMLLHSANNLLVLAMG